MSKNLVQQAYINLNFTLDGPAFKKQRLALLELEENISIPENVKNALNGLTSMTDYIADIAYDYFNLDCLLVERESEPITEQGDTPYGQK